MRVVYVMEARRWFAVVTGSVSSVLGRIPNASVLNQKTKEGYY